MLCRIGWHRPGAWTIDNAEVRFGACARCGCDLVQRDLAWREVPRGMRVVWRPRRAGPPRIGKGGGAERRPIHRTGLACTGDGPIDWAEVRRALAGPATEHGPAAARGTDELTINRVRSRSAKGVARA